MSVIAQAFKHAAEHSDQKLIVLSHVRAFGRAPAEVLMSRLRAEHLLAYLKGDRDGWVRSCAPHASGDLAVLRDWAKRTYDVALPLRSHFEDDDWRRLYDLYDQHIARLLGAESLSDARSKLRSRITLRAARTGLVAAGFARR